MRVNKSHLTRAVSNLTGLSEFQSRQVIDTLTVSIIRSLASGDDVKISGFGKFHVRTCKSRSGRNPRTGAKIEIRSRRMIDFRGFQHLKNRLNGIPEERRAENNRQTLAQGRAVVRISGIAVCEFAVRDISGNGTSILIDRDSAVLRNLQVGQQIEIHMVFSEHNRQASLQRSKIAHITYPKAGAPYHGYVLVGLQVIDRL